MKNIKPVSLLVVLSCFVFSGCFSPWKNDTAKLFINLGGSQERAVFPEPDSEMLSRLEHSVEISGLSEKLNFYAKGETIIEAAVSAGIWNITVLSFLDNEIYAKGTAKADLQPGQDNFVSVKMHNAYLVTFVVDDETAGSQYIAHGSVVERPSDPKKSGCFFSGWYSDDLKKVWDFAADTVTCNLTLYARWDEQDGINVPGADLAEKLSWLEENAISGSKYKVEVASGENIDPTELVYDSKSNITVTLIGTGQGVTINLLPKGSMFTVGSGVTLVLEDKIALRGLPENNAALVTVSVGGTLIMNNGAVIRDNSNEIGGGVYVMGAFTMNGGNIYNNKAKNAGGGVFVYEEATFTMNGGTISGNTAEFVGGGVYAENAYFKKTGGTIYGYSASDSNSNVVRRSGTILYNQGHAVFATSYTEDPDTFERSNVIDKFKDTVTGPNDGELIFDGTKNPPDTISENWDIASNTYITIDVASLDDFNDLPDQIVQINEYEKKPFNISDDYMDYKWYINGDLVPGQIPPYRYVFAGDIIGTYELAVVVTDKAGDKFSGRCWIIVQ